MKKKRRSRWKRGLAFGLAAVMVCSLSAEIFYKTTQAATDTLNVANEWSKSRAAAYVANPSSFWKDTDGKTIVKVNPDAENVNPVYTGGVGQKIDSLVTMAGEGTVADNAYNPELVEEYKAAEVAALALLDEEEEPASGLEETEMPPEGDESGSAPGMEGEDTETEPSTDTDTDSETVPPAAGDEDSTGGEDTGSGEGSSGSDGAGSSNETENTDDEEVNSASSLSASRPGTAAAGTKQMQASVSLLSAAQGGEQSPSGTAAAGTKQMQASVSLLSAVQGGTSDTAPNGGTGGTDAGSSGSAGGTDAGSSGSAGGTDAGSGGSGGNTDAGSGGSTGGTDAGSGGSGSGSGGGTDVGSGNSGGGADAGSGGSGGGTDSGSGGSSGTGDGEANGAVPGDGGSEDPDAASGDEDGLSPLAGDEETDEDGYVNIAELYYTVEYDEIQSGYYRRYYVWNANQLSYLLSYYSGTSFKSGTFAKYLRANIEDISSRDESATDKDGIGRLGIYLLCDLDLGGKAMEAWPGYRNTTVYLEIEGQGNTIYNGYFPDDASAFLGTKTTTQTTTGTSSTVSSDQRFAITNVTFAAMYLKRAGGLFGHGTQYAYFRNADFTDCLAYGESKLSMTIVLGRDNSYVYMRDCTIRSSYVYGSSHSAPFTSYNSGNGKGGSNTYLGDSSPATGYYFTEIPESFDADTFEAIVYNEYIEFNSYSDYKVCADPTENTVQLAKTNFPSIMQNCACIDCEVYISSSNAQHSGGFISCTQGGIIFRECFSNTTMYCAMQAGVFLGACIGSGDGFCCEVEDKKTFINCLFEECYTYGAIEGTSNLGGFVGMIFNDYRWGTSTDRGICVFKNCYSTSSVGMQYSGKYIGGFVGYVRGNTYASEYDAAKSSTDVYMQHRFINCYAAGEVGGITTDVYTDVNDSVKVGDAYLYYQKPAGGFVGYYEDILQGPDSTIKEERQIIPLSMTNCYYDMQTTAMRERDVGGRGMYYEGITSLSGSYTDKNGDCLAGTLEGLTGAYTEYSKTKKGIVGLTDLSGDLMGGASVWSNVEEYYPQLISMTDAQLSPAVPEGIPASAVQMYRDRAREYYYCSLASTATVLLDHYDEILDIYGDTESADLNKNGATVYDTVRDITRKFTFTSNTAKCAVAWEANEAKNKLSDFPGKVGQATNGGNNYTLSLTYDGEEIQDTSLTEGSYSIEYQPNVLTIVKDQGIWKCNDFAPGRQWVTVTCSGDGVSMTRNFRLLPRAYLNAGNMMTVNVLTDQSTGEVTNTVKLLLSGENGSEETVELNGFKHYVGVAYAITDFIRMGTSDIYNSQVLTEYTKDSEKDTASFVLYGGYLLYPNGNSTAVGLDESGKMYEQKFDTTQYNWSNDGRTMVKIYRASLSIDKETHTGRVEKGEEITDAKMLEKFSGEAEFEVSDSGNYYYMTYYWRLNDGRWLEDEKLVYVTADSYTVEMVTGILDEVQTVDETAETGKTRTAIDQYVTDKVSQAEPAETDDGYSLETETATASHWYKTYPSDNTAEGKFLLTDETGADTTGQYYTSYSLDGSTEEGKFDFLDGDSYAGDYNFIVRYGGNSYYAKSISTTTAADTTVVGWRRNTNYKLTTLVIEVNNGGKWEEMTRIDAGASDYNDARYEYAFNTYTVVQDPETKLFSVTEKAGNTSTFTVQSSSQGHASLEKYIRFAFGADAAEGDEVSFSAINTNIRVIALFRNNEANVEAEKQVLFGASDAEALTGENTENMSLDEYDAALKVDNNAVGDAKVTRIEKTGSSLGLFSFGYQFTSASDKNSYAVLAGDTLTYRVKLKNAGYLNSSTVHVYDTVPAGCSYVADSARIYRQKKTVDNGGDTLYGELERMDNEKGYTVSASDEELSWQLPGISLDYEYYVEYQVTVDELDADTVKGVLENTAQWDFVSLSGDMQMNDGEEIVFDDTDLETWLTHIDFDMDMTEGIDGLSKYTISFAQKKDEKLSDICFENIFPSGFTLIDTKGNTWGEEAFSMEKAIEVSGSGGAAAGSYVLLNENGDYSDHTLAWFQSNKNTEYNIGLLPEHETIPVGNSTVDHLRGFRIYVKALTPGGGYDVVFSGSQVTLDDPTDYYTPGDELPIQIQDKASVTYVVPGADGEETTYGNTITKSTRLTNQVSTDVTWLYLDIGKTIPAQDEEQTFLMQIARYESKEDEEPELFYTWISCTGDGEDEAVFSGHRYVRVPGRGIYKITEVTDWSVTDYEFGKAQVSNPAERLLKADGIEAAEQSVSGQTVTVSLPGVVYSGAKEGPGIYAFPTILGTDPGAFPAASFTNTESIYAYRSGQSYAENKISLPAQADAH